MWIQIYACPTRVLPIDLVKKEIASGKNLEAILLDYMKNVKPAYEEHILPLKKVWKGNLVCGHCYPKRP